MKVKFEASSACLIGLILLTCSCNMDVNQKTDRPKPKLMYCIDFELKNSSGERIDGSNRPDSIVPLCFVSGQDEVIKGIELNTMLLKVGQDTTVRIPSNQAYATDSIYYIDHQDSLRILIPSNDSLLVWLRLLSKNEFTAEKSKTQSSF